MSAAGSAKQLKQEADQILARYARRNNRSDPHYQRYREITRRERHRQYQSVLTQLLAIPLQQASVLDIGCGEGDELAWMASLGVPRSNLVGVDLRPEALEVAADRLGVDVVLHAGDACVIEMKPSRFDVIICNIVFSSILDRAVRQALADRITSLLAPGGVLLWTDFIFNNPKNLDVQRVTRSEVSQLFPSLHPHLYRRHLAPPLARRVLRARVVGRAAYSLLNMLPWLRTHLIGGLRPTCDLLVAAEDATCTLH